MIIEIIAGVAVCLVAIGFFAGGLFLYGRLAPRFPRATFLWTVTVMAFVFLGGTNYKRGALTVFVILLVLSVMMTASDWFEYKPPQKPLY